MLQHDGIVTPATLHTAYQYHAGCGRKQLSPRLDQGFTACISRRPGVLPGPVGAPCWPDFLTGWEGEAYQKAGLLGTVRGLKGPVFSLRAEREGARPRIPRELFPGWFHSSRQQLLTVEIVQGTSCLLPAFAQLIPRLLFAELTARSPVQDLTSDAQNCIMRYFAKENVNNSWIKKKQ